MAERLSSEEIKLRRESFLRQYRSKHLTSYDGINSYGVPFKGFHYGEGLQQKICKQVFDKMEEFGFNKTEFFEIWERKSGISNANAKKYMYNNRRGMYVWELNHLLQTFNFSIDIKHNGSQRFEHSIERDRLIIRCLRHPEFHINMNTEQFLDFEVEFKNKHEALKLTNYRLGGLFKKMIEYYFFTKAKNKRFPFKYPDARAKFISKVVDMKEKIDQL